ncbi:hypothetical protein DIPPA_01481 [Diplonema papillatum]|nr:hypothetical protein DIPPA_01481 [Diplonema papillatum]
MGVAGELRQVGYAGRGKEPLAGAFGRARRQGGAAGAGHVEWTDQVHAAPVRNGDRQRECFASPPAWLRMLLDARGAGCLAVHNQVQPDPALVFPGEAVDSFAPRWLAVLDKHRASAAATTATPAWLDALNAECATPTGS